MQKKVLLVDDEVDFVEINKVALEQQGFAVVAAHDGIEAVKVAVAEKPDIVILDVMMTSSTEGFDVARKLRQKEETKDTPIIMLTAVRERMDVKYKIEPDQEWLPVTEFLEKPVPPARLIEKVKHVLEANPDER